LIDAALSAALSEGATLSHHHGVGGSKAHLLDLELGGGLDTLRRVRRAWDPDQLLNPRALEPTRPAPPCKPLEPVPGIDVISGIATFPAATPLPEIEAAAQRHGLSLGLSGPVPSQLLGRFIAEGLPGAPDPFLDPVRGYVCGLEARGASAAFRLLPAPRRATGPDLSALCLGARDEIARAERVSLALLRASQEAKGRASAKVPESLSAGERDAWQRLVQGFSGPPFVAPGSG
jgi:alkyldihydroxyacetonephosphate synthase